MTAEPFGPIVVGYDDTPAARAALAWAADYAAAVGGELLVVYVSSAIVELELAAAQIDADPIRRSFEHRLEGEWTASLRQRRISFRTKVVVGRVATELMRLARAEHAALIVIGMTGRGTLGELTFGSAEHELVKHAVRPVVAVPKVWQHGTTA